MKEPVLSKLGEAVEHAWMLEFLERCFPEQGDRVAADCNTACAMCQAEPKAAQFAMQYLAQEIRGGKLSGPRLSFVRFALGILFTAYGAVAMNEQRTDADGLPPELRQILDWNPEIVECANALGELKS
jgi:hypothetical protein